jgi:glycosyltransferase involved in cell wall biosynthesis
LKVALLSQPRDAIATNGPQHGSVAIVLDALARRLAGAVDVTIVAPQSPGQPRAEVITPHLRIHRVPGLWRNTQRGLEFIRGIARSPMPHIVSTLYFPGYPAGAARSLAEDSPDIVHVMTHSQFAPALRRALPRTKLLLHLHDELHLLLPAGLAGQRLAFFDAIVTCSGWLERGLRERFPHLADRIRHVGNGVDLDAFSPAPWTATPKRCRTLLFVGRISPEKGVHVLVDALSRLRAQHPDLALELVGTPGLLPYGIMRLLGHGPAAEAFSFYGIGSLARFRTQLLANGCGYLEALQARFSPAERSALHVQGPLPHDRLNDAYRAADVFVMPSICEEPFGMPLIEAMACGLPAVATRSGGMSEIVEQGVSGFLVERGDVAGLSGAIATLLDAPDVRASMAAAGRARAEQLFGWERPAGRLMKVYEELARGPRATVARNPVRPDHARSS